ncbi:helix-turn-helix domain-containing protein [Xanthomonas sp. WHRI 7945]|nr:helix-turn-helix domain-containing protein [Xanthomonas campestris pv. campestris]
MSVQAMTWALEQQHVTEPSARHVLLCLANYAGPDGRAAFPSTGTLATDTGLAKRTVHRQLDQLESMGLIRRGNQAIPAAYIDRADRRPVCYDLAIERGDTAASRGVNGVTLVHERGDTVSPNPSFNPEAKSTPLPPSGGEDGDLLRSEAGKAAKPARKVAELETAKFAEFYQAYPRHEARPDAAKAWRKNNCEAQAERIIAEVKTRAAADPQWAKERKYIPLPATYLNGRRWEDQWRDGGDGGAAGLPDFMQGVR